MDLCQYKDMFGKPRTGLHSYRVFDVAVVDVVGTFLLAAAIHYSTGKKYNYWLILIVLFVIGIILHKLFCVDTTVNRILFN